MLSLSLAPSIFLIAKRPKSIISFGFESESEPFRHIFFITSYTAAAVVVVTVAAAETYVDVRFWPSTSNVRNIAVFKENRMNNIIIFYGVAKSYGRALIQFLCECMCVVCALFIVLYLVRYSYVCSLDDVLPFAIHSPHVCKCIVRLVCACVFTLLCTLHQ